MRMYHITPFPIETGMYYNPIIPPPLSAARDNSRQLAGGNARARSSGGIIGYNIFRFRDWKGCNVIRAHDTI